MSMAGLEPARISPHAPQTCAYTDSATSTQTILFNFQSLFCFVLVAEQSLSLLPSPQKQHLVAFSSAECHIDTNILLWTKARVNLKTYPLYFLNTKEALCPPKPNELDNAQSTSALIAL